MVEFRYFRTSLYCCVLVVGRPLGYAPIDIFMADTMSPKLGSHWRYWDEVIQPCLLAVSRSVRRLVCCTIGRWSRIKMKFTHRAL